MTHFFSLHKDAISEIINQFCDDESGLISLKSMCCVSKNSGKLFGMALVKHKHRIRITLLCDVIIGTSAEHRDALMKNILEGVDDENCIYIVTRLSNFQWRWGELSSIRGITELVHKFPTKQWDWLKLSNSQDENLFDLVVKFKDAAWSWKVLSGRVKILHILNNPNFPWNWETVSSRATPSMIVEYPAIPWNLKKYTGQFDISFILENPGHDWDWELATQMTPLEDIKKFYNNFPFDWSCISTLADIKFVSENPHLPWDWTYLSTRKTIARYCLVFPGLPWDYRRIDPEFLVGINEFAKQAMGNENFLKINWVYLSDIITEQAVRANIGFPWNCDHLFTNPNISDRFIIVFRRMGCWRFGSQPVEWLIKRKKVIFAIQNYDWDFGRLSYCSEIRENLDLVSKFKSRSWSWTHLSKHMPLWFMLKHRKTINWDWSQCSDVMDVETYVMLAKEGYKVPPTKINLATAFADRKTCLSVVQK